MSDKKIGLRARPCPTCPYRQDVPSGVWAESEYEKLKDYDGDTTTQALNGALGLFHCHSTPDRICAGWAGCHDMAESLAVRFNWRKIEDVDALIDYESPVPLFASGQEAAEHGMRDYESPGAAATTAVEKVIKIRGTRGKNRVVLKASGEARGRTADD